MAIIKFGGAAMPSPSKMNIEIVDVGDSSRRNARGDRIVDRIAIKRAIELEWSCLNQQELALITAATTEPFITVECLDPVGAGLREGVFRVVSHAAGVLRADERGCMWRDVTMKLEEK